MQTDHNQTSLAVPSPQARTPRAKDVLTETTAKVTGRRWCMHHHGEAAADAGGFVERNKQRRWICFRCQEAAEKCRQQVRRVTG
jgi:hypothetical protein